MGEQHQDEIPPARGVRAEPHHQRALAVGCVAGRIGELVDVQDAGDQEGIRQAGGQRQRRERAALHIVAADDHRQPAGHDRRLADPATHQRQRRGRISPAGEEPEQPDRDQPGAALPAQPQPGRDHQPQHRIAEQRGLAQAQHAVLDEAAAAGEGVQPLGVGRVGAADPVVIIVDHIHAGMREQREDQGQCRVERIEPHAAALRAGQSDQHRDRGHAEKGRAGRREIGRQPAARAIQAGFGGR